MRIVVLGAGGHARVIADAILNDASVDGRLDLVGFLDDDPMLLNRRFLGRPVLGSFADLGNVPHDAVVVGIGDNETRRRLFEELESKGENLVTVIHPHARIAHDVNINKGTVVFAGAIVNTGSVIGKNVILNTGCTVDHDCGVHSHAHVCPGAHLGGNVTVGEGAFLGIGCSISHGMKLGEWSTIGAGSVVIRDIAPEATAVGVPARELPPKPTKHKADTRDLDLFMGAE
jgi:sugar O-acyltransferase (sialic acid O-acetyltransferase NeuD family)